MNQPWLRAGLIGAGILVVINLIGLIPIVGICTPLLELAAFAGAGALAASFIPPASRGGTGRGARCARGPDRRRGGRRCRHDPRTAQPVHVRGGFCHHQPTAARDAAAVFAVGRRSEHVSECCDGHDGDRPVLPSDRPDRRRDSRCARRARSSRRPSRSSTQVEMAPPRHHPHRPRRVLRRGRAAGRPHADRRSGHRGRPARGARGCRLGLLRGPQVRRSLGHAHRGRAPAVPPGGPRLGPSRPLLRDVRPGHGDPRRVHPAPRTPLHRRSLS